MKICHCDQEPGAIAIFVATKICSAPNKVVQRGRRLPLKQAKLIQILKKKTIDECYEAKVLSLTAFTRNLS